MRITPETYHLHERIKELENALVRHEAVTEWHRARRCVQCGDAFQDEGPVWCELHRLIRAALGLDVQPCGHGRDMVQGDGTTHWCEECEVEATGRG